MSHQVFNKTSAYRIAEIQRRYRNGELRHKIAIDMDIGQSTVFKYCHDVYIPGSKAEMSTRMITNLMMGWR